MNTVLRPYFEVRHPRCVSQITKYTADTWSQNTTILYSRTMVTANNYMFRPLAGHHQVVHTVKSVGGCTVYNVTSVWWRDLVHRVIYIITNEMSSSDGSYIVHCTAPNTFHCVYNLMMACWRPKHVVVSCYHRLLYNIVVFWLQASAVYFVISNLYLEKSEWNKTSVLSD
jgi:hypothetical protein